MLKRIIGSLYYVIIPLLIIGISLGYTTFSVTLLVLVPLFFLTTRHTVGFFLVMYGGPLGGVIRSMYPGLPVYGIFLVLIGGLLLWDVIDDLIRNHIHALLILCITLAVFGVFYLLGPRDAFSGQKYFAMWQNGFFALIGYQTLSSSRQVDAEGLTRLLIVGAIFLTSFCITMYNFTPGGIFDFNWFREQCERYDYFASNQWFISEMIVGYQEIGLMTLYGSAILLSQTQIKGSHLWPIITYALLIILMSGCRQAIVGLTVISVMRFSVFRLENLNGSNSIRRFGWLVFGIIVAFFAFELLFTKVDIVSRTVSEGDIGRLLRFKYALQIFHDNPLMGAGLGGYHAIVQFTPWPHNIFLELLCECGIIGTLLLLGIVIRNFVKHKVSLMFINPSNMFYFLLLVALLVRYMVSSDLRNSIELFAAVFAVAYAFNSRIEDSFSPDFIEH